MDKAILGKCRLGYFRLGVKRDDFDKILTRLKATSAKTLGGKTPCLQGTARHGQTRQGVKIPLFDEKLERFKGGT